MLMCWDSYKLLKNWGVFFTSAQSTSDFFGKKNHVVELWSTLLSKLSTKTIEGLSLFVILLCFLSSSWKNVLNNPNLNLDSLETLHSFFGMFTGTFLSACLLYSDIESFFTAIRPVVEKSLAVVFPLNAIINLCLMFLIEPVK